jgi:hypothetical protein
VDITRDVMRLWEEGQSVEEISAYVDQEYSRYGPSNLVTCDDEAATCEGP